MTDLAIPTIPEIPAVPAPPPPPRFGAGMAIATLLLFVFAQMAVGIIVAIGAVVVTIARHGVNDTRAFKAMFTDIGPVLILASAVVAAVVVYFAARAWAWHLIDDRSAGGIGMVAASTRQILVAIMTGVALAGVYLFVAQVFLTPRAGTPLGPLLQIAASGLAGRIVFGFVGLFVAPPVEEFLFRGLLLKGFTESWGATAAGIVVTVVFIGMHIPETMHYWPALIAVSALAAATLAIRLITGSVFTSMALHAAYNGAMVLVCFVVI
jgi:membrane protease YdiL (CAAX protease family)